MTPGQLQSEEYYGIKILRDGTWLYGGTPILRHNLVKLFATGLKRDEKGDYWLETPYEKGRIEVEDAPFTAVELQIESSGKNRKLLFRTNLDDWVEAGPDHPLRVETAADGAPAPYILVRGRLEAKISRAVFYQLVDIAEAAENDAGLFGVWAGNIFYPLGRAET